MCIRDRAYRADTIEELAEQMGIDAEEAAKAVERYNELCEKGIDEDFGKAAEYLIPVKTPPFYGFRETLECQTSLGGIDIDPFNLSLIHIYLRSFQWAWRLSDQERGWLWN